MSDEALARARDDIDVGRLWKARDPLTGLLVHRQDEQVLDLLASDGPNRGAGSKRDSRPCAA